MAVVDLPVLCNRACDVQALKLLELGRFAELVSQMYGFEK